MRIIILTLILLTCQLLTAQEYKTVIESFDNNSGNWTVVNYPHKKSAIKNGKYIIESIQPTQLQTFLKNQIINPEDDYKIEADITKISGPENDAYGITWGFYGWNDYLSFCISSKGWFKIDEKKNGDYIAIKNWTKLPNEVIWNKKRPNTLSISKYGTYISYDINKVEVFSSRNIRLKGTKIGILLSSKLKAEVDNFKTTLKVTSINLVANHLNGYKLENLGPNVNSPYSEICPRITADGNVLYIARNHPSNFGDENKNDIWYTKKDEKGQWEPLMQAEKLLNNTPEGRQLNRRVEFSIL